MIRQLGASGTTVFLNSHLLSEVELVCDRVAIIDKGRVVRIGALSNLLSSQTELEIRVGVVTSSVLEDLGRLGTGVSLSDSIITMSLNDEETIPLVVDTIVRGGGKIYGLTPRHVSLEDLFVNVVEEGQT